jgi:hypothetical protein
VYVAVWMFKANHTGHLILGSWSEVYCYQ